MIFIKFYIDRLDFMAESVLRINNNLNYSILLFLSYDFYHTIEIIIYYHKYVIIYTSDNKILFEKRLYIENN